MGYSGHREESRAAGAPSQSVMVELRDNRFVWNSRPQRVSVSPRSYHLAPLPMKLKIKILCQGRHSQDQVSWGHQNPDGRAQIFPFSTEEGGVGWATE